MVNKMTLLRMKRICWKLKLKKAYDEASSVSLDSIREKESYVVDKLHETNYIGESDGAKVYLKRRVKKSSL